MRNLLASLCDILSPKRVETPARPASRRRIRENRKRLRNRQIKAILAGGLVFGVGATATVAAWTDTETSKGEFTAGKFNIEVSVDGTNWTTTNPSMTFSATAMYPGQKVYAPVFVRTTDGTTVGGKLTVAPNGITGPNAFASALTYRAVARTPEGSGVMCNASNFPGPGNVIIGQSSGVPLSSKPTGLPTQNLASRGTSVQAYCFEVELPTGASNNAQNQSATHTWTFNAESSTTG